MEFIRFSSCDSNKQIRVGEFSSVEDRVDVDVRDQPGEGALESLNRTSYKAHGLRAVFWELCRLDISSNLFSRQRLNCLVLLSPGAVVFEVPAHALVLEEQALVSKGALYKPGRQPNVSDVAFVEVLMRLGLRLGPHLEKD